MEKIRADLKTNPEYLNQYIDVLHGSITLLQKQNASLLNSDNNQAQLIELNDKIEMLNRRFFANGKESLEKFRPNRKDQKELLPHNIPPVEVAPEKKEQVPQIEIVHEQDKCPCCKGSLEEIKGQTENYDELDIIEKTILLKKHLRQKYRCKSCEKIVTAKGGARLKKGSKYSIPFAVSVAVDKFSYHLPLERQSRLFEEQGLKIDTKTLYSQTETLFQNLEPIAEKIKNEILKYGYVHIDETRGKILSTNTNGFIWSMGNKYGAYFQYETTRSGEVASEMLGDFEGVIINDGFSGYNRFKKGRKIKVAHCWSHARRKFFDCLQNYAQAEHVIELIDELFRIDRSCKGSFKRLGNLRKTKSTKILGELQDLLYKLERNILPRSGLGKAVAYTLNLWEGLTHFVKDAKIPLTNNLAERALRNPVKGRDNYNGYRTINGADVAMFYYTIIETCKMLKINSRAYLNDQAYRFSNEEELQTPLEWAQA
ncbi:MAG: IS66 family transposase [Halobacteriovoraceae bacterium]|jgi:transposase|nr:IS66 family transposase [Halobacteriovoraceae bacterium]